MYTHLRTSKKTNYETWRCCERDRCNITLQINSEHSAVVKAPKVHQHAADFDACRAAELVCDIRNDAATNPNELPAQIVRRHVQASSSAVCLKLPEMDSLRKAVNRTQRQHLPANPDSLDDIRDLPNEFATLDGRPWLIHDTGHGHPERQLIFVSTEGLRQLHGSSYWISDGTFRVVPRIFTQLYSIHADIQGKFFPCVYILMSSKSEATYTTLFN